MPIEQPITNVLRKGHTWPTVYSLYPKCMPWLTFCTFGWRSQWSFWKFWIIVIIYRYQKEIGSFICWSNSIKRFYSRFTFALADFYFFSFFSFFFQTFAISVMSFVFSDNKAPQLHFVNHISGLTQAQTLFFWNSCWFKLHGGIRDKKK